MDRRHLYALLVLAIPGWSASPASGQPGGTPAVTPTQVSAPQPALPTPGEGFEAWCKRLQDAEPFVRFHCIVEDDWTEPGHPTRVHRVRWPGTDVGRAFELARALFKVPASVVPPPAGPPEQTIEDPRKPAAVWESTLTVRRAADGSLQELSWYERREGWGRTILARRVDADFVETSEVQFAD
jgi:hypothetical protein